MFHGRTRFQMQLDAVLTPERCAHRGSGGVLSMLWTFGLPQILLPRDSSVKGDCFCVSQLPRPK